MANINRRAALIGAAASSLSLSLPAISSVRAKEPETVPELARRLSAALEQAGEPWQVVVTAQGHCINLDGPVALSQQIVQRCDALAAGLDGWRFTAGRGIMNEHGQIIGRCMGEPAFGLRGIILEPFAGGMIERTVDLGRIA